MKPEAYPKVQAVTAPSVDADVVFDFNDNATWYRHGPLRDGWTLGVASRLSAAGDARTAWGNRRVSFSLQMRGNRSMTVAAQSTLARWLLGAEGWVLFQLDAMSPPVWLRMLGAEPQSLEFDLVRGEKGEDVWTLGISFDADPFLYGERVALFDGEIPNDPTVTDGMLAPLGRVPGDAPMPLRVAMSLGTGLQPPRWYSYDIHSIVHEDGEQPVTAINVGEGDGATEIRSGVTTTAGFGDVGVSCRALSTSTEFGTRQFAVPTPNALPFGTYRVLMYVRTSGWSGESYMRIAHEGVARNTRTATINGSMSSHWVDFGEFVYPGAGVAPDAVSVDPLTEPAKVAVFARRTSAGGDLFVSGILFVPIRRPRLPEARTLSASRSQAAALVEGLPVYLTNDAIFDSTYETTWATTELGAVVSSNRSHHGGWPMATPGMATAIAIIRNVMQEPAESGNPGSDHASNTTVVTVSGHPQWLYLPNHQEA